MPRDTKTHLAQDLVKEIASRIGKNHSRN